VPHFFVSQPIAGGYDLLEFIENVCADRALTRLDFAVAWIKRAGIQGVRPALDDFRGRGGFIRGVVGISLGGTSRQALILARDLCDELFVFHEPGRTFHAKVYMGLGEKRARALVGSNNLTIGGLALNYEAAVVSDLDIEDPVDRVYVDSVTGFIDGLIGEVELCHLATAEFMAKLLADRRYPLLDEDAVAPSGEDPVEGSRSRDRAELEGEALFGVARRPKRPVRIPALPSGRGGSRGRRRTATGTGGVPTRRVVTGDPVVKRWFKKLPAADAQQLTGKSRPSNTMTLVDAGHPIDRNTYFRYVFFASETWSATTTRGGRPREVAMIQADIEVDSTSVGTYELEVRHTPGYASSQGNRVTELGWRGFGAYLRENPLVGRTAVLERFRSGRYRVRFARTLADPFLA
jgi:hypothetical protein